MNNIKALPEKRIPYARLVTIGIMFVILMVYFNIHNVIQLYYDSTYYWTIGDPVFDNRMINLMNFPETFRGYVWPITVQVIRRTGELLFGRERGGFIAFRLATSAAVATFFGITLPVLLGKGLKKLGDIVRMILLIIVILVLWGDFLAYPLSDFAAIFFLAGGMACLKHHLDTEDRGRFRAVVGGVGTGILFYAAYNTRVSYLYAIFIVLIYVIMEYIRGRKVGPAFVIGALVGLLVISMPQSLINHKYTGSYSPRVFTEQYTDYGGSLQKQQVLWGLMYSNYESYMGSMDEYPDARVYFTDVTGNEIIVRERITQDNFTYKTFFKLLIKYPMDMLSIYTRHFISLMTPKFPQMYISDMFPEKGVLILLTVVIWFTTLCNILNTCRKEINYETLVIVIAAFLPSALQLLGAPEIRFFVAIHFIGYFYTIYYHDYLDYKGTAKKNIMPVGIAFIIFTFLWVAVLSSVLNNNAEKVLLIDDVNIYRINQQDLSSGNP